MSHIIWKESFNIGIHELDEQHKKLIEIINEMYDAQKFGTAQIIIKDIMNRLVDYTHYHFSMEEEMHKENRFPKINEHKLEHQEFIERLTVLKRDSDKNNLLLSLKTLDFLKDWTINHILGSDRDFSEYMRHIEGIE